MGCHAADRRHRFGSAPFAARADNDVVAGVGKTLGDLQADASGSSRDHGQTAGLLRVGTHGKVATPVLKFGRVRSAGAAERLAGTTRNASGSKSVIAVLAPSLLWR